MERVVILGTGGAGKSELARELGRRTGLPVVHLDVVLWKPCWTRGTAEQDRCDFAAAIGGERWILDGDFLSVPDGDVRFERADTVLFLDFRRSTCLWHVFKRLVRDRRRSRPDLPEGCREGFDLALLRWIWRYPRVDRPRVLALLAGLDHRVDVRLLRSRTDVRRYVDAL